MSALSDGQVLNLLDALLEIDEQVETLSASKRDLLKDAREQMAGMTRKEINVFISALKKAVSDTRKAQSKPEALEAEEERDALAEHFKSMLASRGVRATPACDIDWSAVKSLRTTNSEAA
jgi:flagellar biosynthesis chaperone FliJ